MIDKNDAPLKKTALALGALLLMLLIGIIFVRAIFSGSFSSERNQQQASEHIIFPQPQPGHFSAESLSKLRADEKSELHTYQWSDSGHAEVPIERAMDIYEAHYAR